MQYEIIFNSKFPEIQIHGQYIKNIIYNIADKETKNVLLSRIDKNIAHPFASDYYDEYLIENLDYENFTVQGTTIQIFGTFLAAALYTKSPVLTADTICSLAFFKTNKIILECSLNNEIHSLVNILLSTKLDNILFRLNEISQQNIDNWKDWLNQLENNQYIKVTSDFISDMNTISFKCVMGNTIRRHKEILQEQMHKLKSGIIKDLNLYNCGITIHDESDSVKNNPKLRRYRLVTDCNGQKNYAFLHTIIGNKVRMYFIPKTDYICLCRVFTQHLPT
ncbi:MAG: hypothetical protein JXB88_13770 [Spirochaetales bacterium]|nr:hypothetical protein [Spirochaetales bacterium]